jgi:hypothetical protein
MAASYHLERLGCQASEVAERDQGQTEIVMPDDDGYSHGFGAAASNQPGGKS